jgi:hypothetical protein
MKATVQISTQPKVKYLVAYQGKGTPYERRIETNIPLYWCEALGTWVSIPEQQGEFQHGNHNAVGRRTSATR